jgi:hypothetical protein
MDFAIPSFTGLTEPFIWSMTSGLSRHCLHRRKPPKSYIFRTIPIHESRKYIVGCVVSPIPYIVSLMCPLDNAGGRPLSVETFPQVSPYLSHVPYNLFMCLCFSLSRTLRSRFIVPFRHSRASLHFTSHFPFHSVFKRSVPRGY